MITITKVLEHVYVLKDRAGCCANLIIGKNKALLFDTGSGIDDIKEAVKNITDLPLMVINSHGHFDHIGGNSQFDEVYLSVDEGFNERSSAAIFDFPKRVEMYTAVRV